MSFCWMIIVPHSRLVGTDRTTLANTCMVILLLLVADSSHTALRALTICEELDHQINQFTKGTLQFS